MHNEPIAIVGVSALFPGALDADEFWRNIVAGTDEIKDVPSTHWLLRDFYDPDPAAPDKTYCRRGAFLPDVAFDPLAQGIPPNILPATDTSQLLALLAAQRVLDDSLSACSQRVDRERISIVLGVTGTTELTAHMSARMGRPQWAQALRESGLAEDEVQSLCDRISAKFVPWQESTFPGLLGNVIAGRVANRLDLGGMNCTVDAACASSLGAVVLGIHELHAGNADLAIVGGVDTLNDPLMFLCFSKTPALSPSGDCRPFSDQADGTMLGEGLGMLALRRLGDAERDGDRIYALIRGSGSSSDGRSKSVYAPRAEGQARAIRRAYAAAGYSPATVELVEAHGTGTKAGDAAEFEGLNLVFGAADSQRRQWCALGTIKSQIGHTKAAAGVAGLLKAALALHHKVLPPTIKVERPHAGLKLEESPFYLNTVVRPWVRAAGQTPRRAAVSSFGFGGSNFHVTLEEYSGPAVRQHAPSTPVELVLLSAESAPALIEMCRSLLQECQRPEGTRAAFCRLARESLEKFDLRRPARLALVVTDFDDLSRTLRRCTETLGTPAAAAVLERDGIYYRLNAQPGKVAFLFPGQGSQFVGMGRGLACSFDAAREVWDRAALPSLDFPMPLHDVVFPQPVFSPEVRAEHEARLRSTAWAQPALGACSLSYLRTLELFGLRPDCTAGHSFGELTALCAAGAFDESQLLQIARRRGELMSSAGASPGAMTAVSAPAARLEGLISGRHPQVVLANRNSPQQTVVSGPTAAIAEFERDLQEQRIGFRRLNVATAFHSPLVADAVEPFRSFLSTFRFQSPRLPVYSNSTATLYEPGPIASLLAQQIAQPVRFADIIASMHDSGVRTFIEVGPGSVLKQLVDQCLPQQEHLAVAVSRKDQDDIVSLWQALGQLAAQGMPIDWSVLKADQYRQPAPDATRKSTSVRINGANIGKPYPPQPGAPVAVANPVRVQTAGDTAHLMKKGTVPPGNADLTGHAPSLERASSKSDSPLFHQAVTPQFPTAAAQPSAPDNTVPISMPRSLPTPAPLPTAVPSASPVLADPWLAAYEEVQRQTSLAHQAYLKATAESHQTFLQTVARTTRELLALHDGGSVPSNAADELMSPAPVSLPVSAVPFTERPDPAWRPAEQPVYESSPEPVSRPDEVAWMMPAPADSFDASSLAAGGIATVARVQSQTTPVALQQVLLEVVAEKTGYPQDVLELEMEIEAGLGIDSIKRVEILSSLIERLPDLPEVELSSLGSMRTLRDILDMLVSRAGAASLPEMTQPHTASAMAPERESPKFVVADLERVLLEVVAEKTGYPQDVLGLEMEIEAGLGIDSIKRVEILSALLERLPGLPELDLAEVGGLRTLQQVLDMVVARIAAMDVTIPQLQPAETPDLPAGVATSFETDPVSRFAVECVPALSSDFALPRIASGMLVALIARNDADVCRDEWETAQLLAAGLRSEGVNVTVTADVPCDAEGVVFLGGLRDVGRLDEALDVNREAFRAARALARRGQGAVRLFVTVQDTGGSFGFAGVEPRQAWLGGLAGLAKTFAHEWPGAAVKAIDLERAGRSPEQLAAALQAELLSGGTEIEVGLRAHQERCTLRSIAAPLSDHGLQATPGWMNSLVLLASGGARGVTALALAALTRRCRLKIVLLGRTVLTSEPACCRDATDEGELKSALLAEVRSRGQSVQPAEINRQVRRVIAQREVLSRITELEAAGAEVRYVSADVRDSAALQRELAIIRQEWGPITGLVHGAGVLADKLIQDKTDEQFAGVFDTKVAGLRALLDATRHDPLRLIALFSSVAARSGNAGQSDYAMANEILNKVAQAERQSRGASCIVKSFNWGPWDGGMVGPELRSHFAELGVSLIAPADGARRFVDELVAGDPNQVEIVLGAAPRQSGLSPGRPRELCVDVLVDALRYPFLDSHRIKDVPVLPLVLVLEWFARAASGWRPDLTLASIHDVKVLRGVPLGDFETRRWFQIVCSDTNANGSVRLALELRSPEGTRHYSCVAELFAADHAPSASTVLSNIGFSKIVPGSSWPWSVTEAYTKLFHGPEFQVLRSLDRLSAAGATATLASHMQPVWSGGPWQTNSPAIDGAMQVALLWGMHNTGRSSLPTRLKSFRTFHTVPSETVLRCELHALAVAEHCHTFNIRLTTIEGDPVSELIELEMSLLGG